MLKKSLVGLMIAALSSSGLLAMAAELTEAEVRAFLAKGDQVANAKDFEAMLGMLAPDAVIEMNVQGQTQRLDREQYQQMLQQSRDLLQGYSYRTKINAVSLSGDKATVKATAYEKADFGENGSFSSVTQETSELEKRGGQLYITRVRSQAGVQKN